MNFKIKDLKERLDKESIDNKHKMLFMWIKQEHINLTEYKELVKNLLINHVCDCDKLPKGEIAISSKAITDPDWTNEQTNL